MASVSHSYDDTFNVYHRRKWVGQIVLMSGGWAAYRVANEHHVVERRIGTYETAELAIKAIA